MRFFPVLLAAVLPFEWQSANTGTRASFRGIHAVSSTVAWASGAGGSVLRFADGRWKTCAIPPGAQKLDLRGIWAGDSRRAIAMSSGPGDSSRLFLTEDACQTWRLLAVNTDRDGFWDAVLFTDAKTGYLLGDPVNGRFVLMRTQDGGMTWNRDDSPALRAAGAGEGAFAASNSALAITSAGDLFFGTGGGAGARIFRRHHGPWTSTQVPLGSAVETAGVFSIAFRDERHGVAVGGDFKQPDVGLKTAIWTTDGGMSWQQARKNPSGYRSSVGWSSAQRAWITVGPSGTDISQDDGATWQKVDNADWNALSLPWVSGPNGRIAQLSVH